MKTISLLILLAVFNLLHSQEHKSIHQLEAEIYSPFNSEENPSIRKESNNIIPLNKNAVIGLNKTVFGFLPDWEYSTAKNNLRYDLLTHIAAFDFPVSSSGSVSFPSGWGNSGWTEIINTAHSQGVKIIMTAVNFNKDDIKILLSNSIAKNNFFNNAKNIIQTYKLDGINVDFEAPYTADRGAPMNSFIQELTTYLHTAIPGTEVSFAGPAINWSGWDLAGLANACDYIFIMGYDFYGSWSTTTGPSSPLSGGANNITTTITSTTKGYGSVIAAKPEKLILGIPYYGNKWTAKTSSAFSDVITYKGSTRFKDDAVSSSSYGRIWENSYQVPWYRYQTNGEWYQVWYDDQQSLGLKYDLAISKKMKGVGMWALGYDGSRSELWDLIEKKFKPVLPVELVSFDAALKGPVVELKWKTASELNNFGFDIERKADNEKQFIKIGFVAGGGSRSEPADYNFRDNVLNLNTDIIQYRLKQIDSNGSYLYSDIIQIDVSPEQFYISQNYPNPFNPSTMIQYQVADEGLVSIKIFNLLGDEIRTLVNKQHSPGNYEIEFIAGDLCSGVYLYTFSAGSHFITKKMMLIR